MRTEVLGNLEVPPEPPFPLNDEVWDAITKFALILSGGPLDRWLLADLCRATITLRNVRLELDLEGPVPDRTTRRNHDQSFGHA